MSTTHLKNADVDAAAVAPQPLYELCTDDWSQALEWSELGAQSSPQYSDLVETNDDPRYFEFGRVRQGDPTFYVRSRVFKCAYLDRASVNLRAAAGAAGTLNRRPPTAADLREMSEYLWQFTQYNNVGYAVLQSSGSSTTGTLTHTLHMGVPRARRIVQQLRSRRCHRVASYARHDDGESAGGIDDAVELWRERVGAASCRCARAKSPT